MYPGDIDEDDAIMAAFRELPAAEPNLQLLIAPRKPERFDAVEAKAGIGLSYAGARLCQVLRRLRSFCWIRLGELSSLFPLADVVFMGAPSPNAVDTTSSSLPLRQAGDCRPSPGEFRCHTGSIPCSQRLCPDR